MKHWIIILILASIVLAACGSAQNDGSQADLATEQPAVPTEPPVPTATDVPPVEFTLCTARLPESFFPYTLQSPPASDAVMALFREPALIRTADDWLPGILTEVPSDNNAGIQFETVSVQRGERIVDAQGELVLIEAGVTVRPSGCRDSDCVITWDGAGDLSMDRMVVTFNLQDDLAWSDGVPVTAGDSVLSFQLASGDSDMISSWFRERTQSFNAVDESTLQWVGRPGFSTTDLASLFWLPLPAHLVGEGDNGTSLNEAQQADVSTLSYGPFVLVGQELNKLQFETNPHYFRAVDGNPGVDRVIVRAVEGGPQAAWEDLRSGQCDLLDDSFELAGHPEIITTIMAEDGMDVHITPGKDWTQLVFGIQPAIYDQISTPFFSERPDYFGDVRTRQGIAHCLDRQMIVDQLFTGLSEPWPSFLLPDESFLASGDQLFFNPDTGVNYFEEAGWHLTDGGEGVRIARDVALVPNGTRLSLELLVSETRFHQDLAGMIQESLAACGVEVQIRSLTTNQLYAPGPDGPLFGRAFDLALITWQPMPDLDCHLYSSWQIPAAGNQWIGTNLAGVDSPDYDRVCTDAALAVPGEQDRKLLTAEQEFLSLMPAVPFSAPPGVTVFDKSDWCKSADPGSTAFYFSLQPVSMGDTCP